MKKEKEVNVDIHTKRRKSKRNKVAGSLVWRAEKY